MPILRLKPVRVPILLFHECGNLPGRAKVRTMPAYGGILFRIRRLLDGGD
jgi:hypothetical protein